MPVKPIDWFDDLLCLGMKNQLIMVSQLINIMKVDHRSHDNDKEECNTVIDKGLFKSTNWFLNLKANDHFCYNTDYFI
jgi:hypothetical protein